MQSTKNLILVCAGSDTAAAEKYDLPLLQLCLGIGRGGAITRLSLPAKLTDCYLGVSDLGLDGTIPDFCAEALLHEVRQHNMRGLFADIEQVTPSAYTLLRALDRLAHAADFPLFVPLVQAEHVEHAILVAETAISGGSLDDYFDMLQTKYPTRIAATIRPVSTDFSLPAQDSEGHPLSADERRTLQQTCGAQSFFSRELCAKYFTYMDPEQKGHFVLYDDASTLEAKLNRLNARGISHIFALYPDIAALLPPLTE